MTTTSFIGLSIVVLIFIVINMNAITQTIIGDNGNVESITKGNNELGNISRTTPLNSETRTAATTTTTTTLPKCNNKNNTTSKVNGIFETLLNETAMTVNLMTVQKIEISAANPSNFNKNSLQQSNEAQQAVVHRHHQQHKHEEQSPSPPLPQQRHHHKHQYTTLDNKHPPCEYAAVNRDSIVTDGGNESIITTTNTTTTTNGTNSSSSTISIIINNTSKKTRPIEFDAIAEGSKPLISPNTLHSVDTNNNEINNSRTLLSAPTSQSTSPTPTPTSSPSPSSTFNVARNGFRDKINISNQQNEFTSQVDGDEDEDDYGVADSRIVPDANRTAAAHRREPHDDVGYDSHVQLVTSAMRPIQKYMTTNSDTRSNRITTSRNPREDTTTTNLRTTISSVNSSNNNYVVPATSSFFEHVELLESRLSSDKRNELRLHRRKRYLVFPEGSSFQLVFDLIIGIVDYTSYAILGITCSVAWELPSKPPSEIIENFREKLHEGTFGLHRRNDSTDNEQLQYIDTENKKPIPITATQLNTNFGYENAWKPQKNDGKEKNYYQQQEYVHVPKVAAASSPTATRYYGYKAPNEYGNFDRGGAGGVGGFGDSDGGGNAFDMAAGVRLAEAQRKTLNEKAAQQQQQQKWKWQWYSPKPDKTYTKYKNGYSTKQNYEWRGNDKWKYASTDWHRQRVNKNGNNDNYNEHDDYNADSVNYDGIWQRQRQRNHAKYQKKVNSWQPNSQRWRDKQMKSKAWTQYGAKDKNWDRYTTKKPITTYAMPVSSENVQSNTRSGYERTLLKEPPKHRIYPVFGRKKRSLKSFPTDKPSRAFEQKLERIHLREQLRSRQKLYGKIEQLFQTRGHNGTACVLRALCETGQRHQLPLHHRQRGGSGSEHRSRSHSQSRQYDHEERGPSPHSTAGQQQSGPQSFITELLRAIFALPKDIRSREFESQAMHSHSHFDSLQREFEEHISWHYRDAHAHEGNCAERFASCEHSIWNDGIRHSVDDVVAGRAFKM